MDLSVPAGAGRLLDLIRNTEAPQGYDTVFGNADMPQPITSMTINAVIEDGPRRVRDYFLQHGKQGSSAAGAYQFMPPTLKAIVMRMGLTGNELMDEGMQDRMAFDLLKQRGYARFAAGLSSIQTFALGLAQEWASFPVLQACKGATRQLVRGQSYYAGDGLNKALIPPEKVEACLEDVLAEAGRAPIVKQNMGLAPYEVKAIQGRLLELGYAMVGKADGIWGARTTAALSAFQHSSSLTVTGLMDDDTKAALAKDDAAPMQVDPDRATTTAADLAPTSRIVRDAGRIKTFAYSIGGAAAAGPVAVGGVIDNFTTAKTKIQPFIDTFTNVPTWAWGIAGIGVAYGIYRQGQKIEDARVEMHQTGETA